MDFNNIMLHEFLPRGPTINKERIYKFNTVCVKQSKETPGFVAKQFISLLVHEVLAKSNTVTMSQSPYSPNMAPGDFFLFPKMKGRRFISKDDNESASLKKL